MDKQTRDGVVPTRLTNFTARIVVDTVLDNGADTSRRFEIEAGIGDRSHAFSVPAEQFQSMGWVATQLGAEALVLPGPSNRDHARAAIQILSGRIAKRRIYTHSGWLQLPDGTDVFLHSGGAIGPDGPVRDVAVELDGPLRLFRLPEPPTGRDLRDMVRATFEALEDLAPPELLVPVFGAAYRAVLGSSDFSVYLVGPTGAGKSELVALSQQHFGPEMTRLKLPESWESTANALEELAFLAKDVLLVIDDFAPKSSRSDMERQYGVAERIMRAVGNGSGRGRMRPDTTLRPPHQPRALVLATGEEPFRGVSLNARVLTLEVQPDNVNFLQLTIAQNAAASGVFAEAMSGFISFLARDLAGQQADFRDKRAEFLRSRDSSEGSGHKRTPQIVADLAAAWAVYLNFAEDIGAIKAGEADHRWKIVRSALRQQGAAQALQIAAADPVEQFLHGLSSVLSTGKAHLLLENGSKYLFDSEWGDGRGEHLGYVTTDGLYLDLTTSFGVAQRLFTATGEPLRISMRSLSKRLYEKGYLAGTGRESSRESTSVRRTFDGHRGSWLHLRRDVLSAAETDQLTN